MEHREGSPWGRSLRSLGCSRATRRVLNGFQASDIQFFRLSPYPKNEQSEVCRCPTCWFAALPEKLKRHLFSMEDRDAIDEHCNGQRNDRPGLYHQRRPQQTMLQNTLETETHVDAWERIAVAENDQNSPRKVSCPLDEVVGSKNAVSESQISTCFPDASFCSVAPSSITQYAESVEVGRCKNRSFRRSFTLRPLPISAPTLARL